MMKVTLLLKLLSLLVLSNVILSMQEEAALLPNYFSLLPDVIFHVMIDYLIADDNEPEQAFKNLQSLSLVNKKNVISVPDYFISRWLIKRQAKNNIHIAVRIGAFSWVHNYLHAYNADKNQLWMMDVTKRTPLMWAIIRNNIAMITFLSDYMSQHDDTPLFPLEHELDRNFFTVMYGLYRPQKVLQKDLDHYCGRIPGDEEIWITPLIYAIVHKYYAVVQYLIARGASVQSTDSAGSSPLHHAVDGYYDADIVLLLLKKGANVQAGDQRGSTPLIKIASVYNSLSPLSNLYIPVKAIHEMLIDYAGTC